jgi:hypothetical protein
MYRGRLQGASTVGAVVVFDDIARACSWVTATELRARCELAAPVQSLGSEVRVQVTF